MRTSFHGWICALFALLAIAALPAVAEEAAAAPEPAGTVQTARGRVTATVDDQTRFLREGDPVYAGERLATGRRGLVLVRMRDDSKFGLGANAEMTVEAFEYGANEETLTTRIVRGTFRFVSGLIAKRRPAAMQVRLAATATIGIRGTHVAGEVEGEAATVVLMPPEEGDTAQAITVSNEHGSVEVEEPGYGTTVPDANSPPTPVRRMRVRTIDNLMRSLQTVRRSGAIPRPRPQGHR